MDQMVYYPFCENNKYDLFFSANTGVSDLV